MLESHLKKEARGYLMMEGFGGGRKQQRILLDPLLIC